MWSEGTWRQLNSTKKKLFQWSNLHLMSQTQQSLFMRQALILWAIIPRSYISNIEIRLLYTLHIQCYDMVTYSCSSYICLFKYGNNKNILNCDYSNWLCVSLYFTCYIPFIIIFLHRVKYVLKIKCHRAAVNLNTMTSKDVISTLRSINQLICSSKRLLFEQELYFAKPSVIQTYYYHRVSINFYKMFKTQTEFKKNATPL